jgi:5'(3')-deoxyribonucleotidase
MEFRNSLIDKYDWMAEHFPFIDWQHIMFCGNKIVNVDIIIDDRIKNFVNFTGRPLLFSSPHNLLVTEYERVNTWEEVAGLLL